MQELSKDQVLKIMERYGNDPQQLIAVLLDIQAASGKNCVEKQWAQLASTVLNVPLSKIFDVLTFYAMFSTQPRGEYVIEICRSTPCFFSRSAESDFKSADVKSADLKSVARWFEEAAGVKIGQTTADGKISLFYTSCVGSCDIGPVAKIGDDVFGNLTEDKVKNLVERCREGKEILSLCQN